MGLYRLFSYNVEVQYKSYFFSKAMLFALTTSALNIILPLVFAYRSRGFWLETHHFYEQPMVKSTYDYVLIAETEDPSISIVCGNGDLMHFNELCSEVQIQEFDNNKDTINDIIRFKLKLNVPETHTIMSIILILALDFHLLTVCPLQMQALSVINKEFSIPASGLKYHGNLEFYQKSHLPCLRHHIDTTYNTSLINSIKKNQDITIDFILESYFTREVISQINPMFVRSMHGHTGILDIELFLKIPEVKVLYIPSLLQELKWAWPQYLSLVILFYWIIHKIKSFVFRNRLLMAWEIIPWKTIDNK
ncbi:transmembrane protein 231 isoform X1 [Pieris rapae]|uniref:transmembrane protein 231 isoform X1 n=1 Tax=Pieris rapae TaxID=64459 RepID=UPI001E27CC10|nr:transmembrane protein 231 isoform X1 [Pieris rapae]